MKVTIREDKHGKFFLLQNRIYRPQKPTDIAVYKNESFDVSCQAGDKIEVYDQGMSNALASWDNENNKSGDNWYEHCAQNKQYNSWRETVKASEEFWEPSTTFSEIDIESVAGALFEKHNTID